MRLLFSSSKYCGHRKCYSRAVTLSRIVLRYYRDFDGSVSSNVRYIACSHGTDCHAESQARRVQCFKMVKIDPVSPFYLTLFFEKRNFAMRKPTRSTKNEPLGCKYLLSFVRLEIGSVYTVIPPAHHENS